MQKVLGHYQNRKKLLNCSKRNPLQSFYKINFICWLIIAINFEQRDVIMLSVRDFYITPKIIIKKFSKLWQFLFPHFNDVTAYSLVDTSMFKFEFPVFLTHVGIRQIPMIVDVKSKIIVSHRHFFANMIYSAI